MLKNVVLVVIFFLSQTALIAQSIGDLKKCVVFLFGQIHTQGPDGKRITLEMPLGTGFFVSYPDPRGGREYSFGYLVTAKHVLRDSDGAYLKAVSVRANLLKPTGDSDLATTEIAVTDNSGHLLWFEDKDDPQNDVVLTPGIPDPRLVEFKMVPVGMFADTNLLRERNVQEGDSVYLLGLMPQYYGKNKNYPVVRRGALALLTDEPIQTGPDTRQHAYLAELASWPGNSGAPVFLDLAGFRGGSMMLGSEYHLLGLMLGFFSNLRQANIVESRSIVGGDPSNIGISFILPAPTIRKVLDSGPLQKLRDEAIKSLVPARLGTFHFRTGFEGECAEAGLRVRKVC